MNCPIPRSVHKKRGFLYENTLFLADRRSPARLSLVVEPCSLGF